MWHRPEVAVHVSTLLEILVNISDVMLAAVSYVFRFQPFLRFYV